MCTEHAGDAKAAELREVLLTLYRTEYEALNPSTVVTSSTSHATGLTTTAAAATAAAATATATAVHTRKSSAPVAAVPTEAQAGAGGVEGALSSYKIQSRVSQFLRAQAQEQVAEVALNELEQYLQEPLFIPPRLDVDQMAEFDVLKWWKDREFMYPTLSKMVKDILAIPATSIPSESIFTSSASVEDSIVTPAPARVSVISDSWAGESDETIRLLMLSKSWLKVKARQPIEIVS
jgi:hypothetical protein